MFGGWGVHVRPHCNADLHGESDQEGLLSQLHSPEVLGEILCCDGCFSVLLRV